MGAHEWLIREHDGVVLRDVFLDIHVDRNEGHLRPEDKPHLVHAIDLARRARARGDHPFGSVLVDARGRVLLEGENTQVTTGDCTGHAESNLMGEATRRYRPEELAGSTLYASTEPCAMCAGAIFWGGVRRV